MHLRYNGATRNSMEVQAHQNGLERRDEDDHGCDRRFVTETMVGT